MSDGVDNDPAFLQCSSLINIYIILSRETKIGLVSGGKIPYVQRELIPFPANFSLATPRSQSAAY